MESSQAELFKVLGVVSRIRIIELLKSRGKITVSEISSKLDITPSAVSQHLKILKHAGLVNNERKGYWIPYEINPEALLHCYRVLTRLCSCGCICAGEGESAGEEEKGERVEFLSKFKNNLEEELKLVEEEIVNLEKSE